MTMFGWLAHLASLVLIASPVSQEVDPMVGAWAGQDTRDGVAADVVVIFTEAHQVAVWFDPASGEVVHSNGGLWSREGVHVTEVVEFDSDNPGRVGSSVSFDIELTDTELSIVGFDMTLTRIDSAEDGLPGAWEMFEVSHDPPAPGSSIVRLMSATRFQEIHYEPETGRLLDTSGGTYALDGDELVETEAFSNARKGRRPPARFSVERDGDIWGQTDSRGTVRSWRGR